MTTDRYLVRWTAAAPQTPPIAPSLDGMQGQGLAWAPGLSDNRMRLWLVSPGRRSAVAGLLRLGDGSWVAFQTLQPVAGLNLAAERVLLAEAEAPLRDETRNAPSADHPRSANEKEGKKS